VYGVQLYVHPPAMHTETLHLQLCPSVRYFHHMSLLFRLLVGWLVGWFVGSLRSFVCDVSRNASPIFVKFCRVVKNHKDKKTVYFTCVSSASCLSLLTNVHGN